MKKLSKFYLTLYFIPIIIIASETIFKTFIFTESIQIIIYFLALILTPLGLKQALEKFQLPLYLKLLFWIPSAALVLNLITLKLTETLPETPGMICTYHSTYHPQIIDKITHYIEYNAKYLLFTELIWGIYIIYTQKFIIKKKFTLLIIIISILLIIFANIQAIQQECATWIIEPDFNNI